MVQIKLSFAQINKISPNIAEVIVKQDTEITLNMVKEYHCALLKNFEAPIGLLINKIHSYTYTFEAQIEIANLDEIKFMAVVSRSTATSLATKNLQSNIPRKRTWNLEIFGDREDALGWLNHELKNLIND